MVHRSEMVARLRGLALDFIADNYALVVRSEQPRRVFYSFTHHFNGSVLIVVADLVANRYEIKHSGHVVKASRIIEVSDD